MLTHISVHWTLGIYITFSLLGGICSLLLPIETKGKGLEQINNDLLNLSRDNKVDVAMETENDETELDLKSFDNVNRTGERRHKMCMNVCY